MASAWVFQKGEDVERLGADQASWYAGWYEPDGRRKKKSFGPGFRGKKLAERFARKVEAELMTGTYAVKTEKLWADFLAEYDARILSGLAPQSRDQARAALAHYERLMKPVKVFVINTGHVDEFISRRREEAGKKQGARVSPATINKDLRHLRAALNTAREWGYLGHTPRFRMEKVPKRLPTYVTPEHFALLYGACAQAKRPADQPYPAADWWRALLVMGYLTGWRIGQLLAFRRNDLDLDAGTAVSMAEDNKGNRDVRLRLHPVIVEHLQRLPGFDPRVFPWNHNRRTLDDDFLRIQQAAKIHLPCRAQHAHTPKCHAYGFHDLRRAFATMNADRLSADALQQLMQHKSYETTKLYVNLAKQLQDEETVRALFVPDVLKEQGRAAP
jgi:integrase